MRRGHVRGAGGREKRERERERAGEPEPPTAAPVSAALTATARPWRVTRLVQPLVSVSSSAPAGPAANSRPSTSAPPKRAATAGKSATGIANSIALMSTR